MSQKNTFFDKYFGPEACTAKKTFKNRWLLLIPAFSAHMCIGAPYAWSVMAMVLNKEHGFVVQASTDWSLAQATFPISIIFAFQGISSSLAGNLQQKYGPRASMACAGLFLGGGFIVGSTGIYLHSLALLYAGYGVMGGCGVGICYTPPIQVLMRWFPDRKGIASGITIAGFGSGALVFAPLVSTIMKNKSVQPQFLGNLADIKTINKDGVLYTTINDQLKEIVVATQADISKIPYDLQEGAYLVGSGNTGAAYALGCVGALYTCIMLTSAFSIKFPHADYRPPSYVPGQVVHSLQNVTSSQAIRLPQFYAFFSILFNISAGGFAMFAVARTMMGDVFMKALPSIVDSSFTQSYVMMLSLGNLVGRLGWASFSDKYGRKLTFNIFGFGSIPLYALLPFLINQVVQTHSVVPMYGFMASTFLIATMLGGTFAALPAYESDKFGTKYIGNIHGKILLSLTFSALGGPQLLFFLKSSSEYHAMKKLLSQVDPEKFYNQFGCNIDLADQMIQAKSLNIQRILQILPPGTLDPTPYLYDSALYTMSGLMALAAIANYTLKEIDPKYFEKIVQEKENINNSNDQNKK